MQHLSFYDYDLPEDLIAKEPLAERDASRLLVVDRAMQTLSHRMIRDLPSILRSGDCLVLNDTKVVPARLLGIRTETGGRWEGLYLGSAAGNRWRLIGQTRGKLQAGESLTLQRAHDPESEEQLHLTLVERDDDGIWLAEPDSQDNTLDVLNRFGTVPLPPYIQRDLATSSDWARYQTTYADRPGSVAAPTAGLHFTNELLDDCCGRAIERAEVTLHVGIGTFRPITTLNLDDHQMHSEWCELSDAAAQRLNQVRTAGGRIVAVGTTSVRTLESACVSGRLDSHLGETNLFIRPGYTFGAVDCLLTNFHLPKSTLFVLVCAFAGSDLAKQAYAAAIEQKYRFFSYGDAMLIL
jgi:S-adenosylmethionine:tRNA ribosyltransferase-isomerase